MTRPVAVPTITIDGPSGSGKGTIARRVARRLGWHLLDSGALYRVVALAAERRGVGLDDEGALARVAEALDVQFLSGEATRASRVLLEGDDVSDAIRSERCGESASRVAALPAVRSALLARQRELRHAPGLVADGRDMGTVVFPDADAKIFLTASAEERARRRYKQLKDKGIESKMTSLSEEIAARDKRDRERAAAPLRPAEDAVVIDTTELDIDVVLERVLALAAARGLFPD
ncbi:MAG: (d)CMP kinase [Gammaproteobacteria bacterium]|nr:(d)CMP kinase [Gammaproteobacteria bacterium]NIR82473.1 (d)CMP kinase [Gammaproteobacteria bacterium]NIR88469.1 (d)CMP kinase [Gammaproteobacteria bacterium]NIU03609.1 (d)CMP kinase [Gammaproteobacteria bacterium]NIV50961.1 (d)CMP kinase [Gammaproteobacteria bacterium]